jgi:hypothetical protein
MVSHARRQPLVVTALTSPGGVPPHAVRVDVLSVGLRSQLLRELRWKRMVPRRSSNDPCVTREASEAILIGGLHVESRSKVADELRHAPVEFADLVAAPIGSVVSGPGHLYPRVERRQLVQIAELGIRVGSRWISCLDAASSFLMIWASSAGTWSASTVPTWAE